MKKKAITEITTMLPRTTLCPECGEVVNAAAHVSSPEEPGPGDVSICAFCGALLQYDALMQPVPMSEQVRKDMAEHQPEEWAFMLEMQAKVRSRPEEYAKYKKPKIQ